MSINTAYLNPFDDEQHEFLVLLNQRNEYSLWPVFAARPAGWNAVYGPASRAQCVSYVESEWHSINPFSTADQAAGHVAGA